MKLPHITLGRLSTLWSRARPWILASLVLFPWSLLLLGGLGGFLPGAGLPTGLLVGLPLAAVAAVVAWRLVQERRTIRLRTRVLVTDPVVPVLGRATLRVEILSVRIERGRARRQEESRVEVRLRGGRHGEALAWCSRQLAAQLDATAERLRREHVGARIEVEAAPAPAELARRLAPPRPETSPSPSLLGIGERAWERTLAAGSASRRWLRERVAGRARGTGSAARPASSARAARSVSAAPEAW